MSFDYAYWARTSVSGNENAAIWYSYRSPTDTLATIKADGYFNERIENLATGVGDLNIGDVVHIDGTDGHDLVRITSITTNVTVGEYVAKDPTEELWARTGTVLSPYNSGDSVDMSAASVSSTFVPTNDEHLTNKLYVDTHRGFVFSRNIGAIAPSIIDTWYGVTSNLDDQKLGWTHETSSPTKTFTAAVEGYYSIGWTMYVKNLAGAANALIRARIQHNNAVVEGSHIEYEIPNDSTLRPYIFPPVLVYVNVGDTLFGEVSMADLAVVIDGPAALYSASVAITIR